MEEYDRASDDPTTTDAESQALQHQWFSLMEEVDQAVRIGTDPTTGRTVRDLKIERGWYEFKWIQ